MSEARDFWGGGEGVERIDALVGSLDLFERWAAAIQLGETGGPGAAERLKRLLQDDEEYVREAAELSLKRLAAGDGAGRSAARVVSAEHAATQAPGHRRRIRSHTEAATFSQWKVKRLPEPTPENEWVVETLLLDIIQVEGPIRGSRLMRLYAQGCRMSGSSNVSHSRLYRAVKSLLAAGAIARSDDFRSDRVESWILHERGTPGVMLRQRGSRELRDIPPNEVVAGLAASTRRSSRGGLDRDLAFGQIIEFYDAGKELHLVGALLTNEWASILG